MLCPFTVYCQVGIFFIFSLLLPGFWWHWTKESVSVFVSRQQIFPELHPGLPLSFELGIHTSGGLFLGIRYAGCVDFWRFRTPSFPIFGVILGTLEMTKI